MSIIKLYSANGLRFPTVTVLSSYKSSPVDHQLENLFQANLVNVLCDGPISN